MSLTAADIKKIAHLARLNIPEQEVEKHREQLSHILDFVEQMNQADTTHATAAAHAFESDQRLRPDVVTETNQRAAFQAIAPQVEAGLYLVPKVIEGE